MMSKVTDHNRAAWDQNVEAGNRWSQIVSEDEIAEARAGRPRLILTPRMAVPDAWLGDLTGKRVLGLAAGGGQQGPLLAAAGADVTVADLSPAQLRQDRRAAEQYGLEIQTVETPASDLSMFEDGAFDLIFNPVSNCFFEDLDPVWSECHRVLKPGGCLLFAFNNPVIYLFDFELAERKDTFLLKYKQPYTDLQSLTEEEREAFLSETDPLEFGHSLDTQIGLLLKKGFMLKGLYEDEWDTDQALNNHFPQFVAAWAVKPGSH